MSKHKRDKIYEVLIEIEKSLNKQNSISRVFILGLFRGLGTTLGATVLLAIATSIALQFSDNISFDNVINYLFNSTVIE